MFEKIKCLSLIWMERSILGMNYSHHQRFFKESTRKLEENIISLPIIHQKASGLILRNLGSLGYRSRKIR